MKLEVLYTNNKDMVSVVVNDRLHDVKLIEEYVYQEFLKKDPSASDDFWVEEAIFEYKKNKVFDVTPLCAPKLTQEVVDFFGENDQVLELIAAMTEYGEDVKTAMKAVENGEVRVYETDYNDKMVDGNYGQRYPEFFVDEMMDVFAPTLVKALEDNNCYGYFEDARLVSDWEVNGAFKTGYIDNTLFYVID